ncbi:P-loop ATPase, Sll1717 family [Pseudoduganella albidiflava]|uniref:AAA+ ATPase domain-containing protein n=1 Tax=Pseudoduganella albidiflava TaxID=321983 RepID=A0A411WWR1_9BURK|nr:ATP-binding protein [Pseudoduganella albidiflava]QBI01233.1 hypothetical protein EYF70_10575 [Pseudoduganella albidiflava]GGY49225.1 hypothetical protein GCM10007387_34390 [Pseudoduganella albidiflava]
MSALRDYQDALDNLGSTVIQRPVLARVQGLLFAPERPHVFLAGERGSGKTLTLRMLARQLRGAGHVVAFEDLFSPDSENVVGQVLSAFVQLLLQARSVDQERIAELSSIRSALLSAAYMRGLSERVFQLAGSIVEPGQRIFMLLDGVDGIADRLSAERLLDWAGGVPREVLQVVVAGSPVHRDDTRLARRFGFVSLDELTREETDALVQRYLARRKRPPMDAEGLAAMFRETRGHPKAIKNVLLWSDLDPAIAQRMARGEAFAADFRLVAEHVDSILSNIDDELPAARSERYLLACAILQPVARSRLLAWSALPEEVFNAWTAHAVDWGLVTVDQDTFLIKTPELRANLIRDRVLGTPVLLSQLGFGDEAAERDKLFSTSFTIPEDVGPIMRREKTIVLGDRGAGKSAIFRMMSENIGGQVPDNVLVVGSQNPNDFLQALAVSQPIASAEKFKAFWLLYVATLAAQALQDQAGALGPGAAAYGRDARRLLREVHQGGKIRGEPRGAALLAGLRAFLPEKVSFTVGPVTVDQALGGGIRSRSPLNIVGFLASTDALLVALGKSMVVIFDQIDESHKYERAVQESLVQGLMLAESYLSQKEAIRLTVLLRNDLFEIYDIQEKNKFVSRTASLRWSADRLVAQLVDRAASNASIGAIRDVIARLADDAGARTDMMLRVLFPEEIEGKSFRQWLFDGLENANKRVSPRQIILFLNILRDKVRNGGAVATIPLFSEASVVGALTELSEHSYKEVVADFRVAVGFVMNCRAGKFTRFKLDDVAQLFDDDDGPRARQIEQLQRLGFLEAEIVVEDGRHVRMFQIPGIYTRCWS